MRVDIRIAALSESVEQRVRLAASLLKAYQISATVGGWDGTRCNLLIAASDDAYGQRAIELARQRGLATIPIGNAVHGRHARLISSNTQVAELVRHMHERLCSGAWLDNEGSTQTEELPGICRLAQAPLRGRAVDARLRGRSILLSPKLGRVYAPSWSDMIAAGEALAESPWEMVRAKDEIDTGNMASTSIEAFLVQAAYRARDQLPEFPDGCYSLQVWPDLGSIPSLIGALRIARQLIGNTTDSRKLVQMLPGVTMSEINACLWAFAAADLLRQAASGVPKAGGTARSPPMREGIWSSLARKFGLLRV